MKKELRFCIEYVCPTHPFNDDDSINIRHFRTLSEEEAENALVLLLECGCKLIDLYRGNVQDGKLDEWSPLSMIVNQNEDFYVDGDFDSYPNKGDLNMTRARRLLKECCERCTEWSSTDVCEDHITCPIFQLYVLADRKEKVVYKQDVWQTPPPPKPEMI